MLKKQAFGLLIICFLLALVGIGAAFLTRRIAAKPTQPEAAQPVLSPSPSATWDLSDPHYVQALKQWQDAIDKASSEQAKNSLRAKMQGDIIGATQAAESKLHILQGTQPARVKSGKISPTFDPEGIDNNPRTPADEQKYVLFTNSWRKVVTKTESAETIYLVFAGALADDETQGIVLVSPPDQPGGFYKIQSPTKSGKLRIVSEDNGVLQLSSEQGETFYFDYTWREFVPDNHPFVPTLFPTQLYPAPADTITPVPAYP